MNGDTEKLSRLTTVAAQTAEHPRYDRNGLARWGRRLSFQGAKTMAWALGGLGRLGPVREAVARSAEKTMNERLAATSQHMTLPPRVSEDILALGLAAVHTIRGLLADRRIRPSVIRNTAGVLLHGVLTGGPKHYPQSRFVERYGVEPPGLFLLSPTNACNLRCKGCYADSQLESKTLAWPILDRLVSEAEELWGAHFMVLTGGEPLAYRSEGHGILDLAEAHHNLIYMMYTNGTLIDDAIARRIGRLGNLTPAISLEGLEERTDRRRGAGTFAKAREAAERLRREGVVFGVSLTATCENAEEILSDEAVEFYFEKLGAAYAWVFHYMPIGRSPSLKLLPTAQQRFELWKRGAYLVRERKLFVADFWNGGTLSKGCLSAGRPGGFLAVNGKGQVSPCVFMPYSPVNVNEVFAAGKDINDIWSHPFFARIRHWQDDYGYHRSNGQGPAGKKNWMMPCPIRDHHGEFHEWLETYRPEPLDENARAASVDPDYRKGMEQYNREVATLMDPVWDSQYLKRGDRPGAPGPGGAAAAE